jgi:hypothetical protein
MVCIVGASQNLRAQEPAPAPVTARPIPMAPPIVITDANSEAVPGQEQVQTLSPSTSSNYQPPETAGSSEQLPPRVVRFQEVPMATDPTFPLPLYHDRPERGGFYAAAEFLYMRMKNPLDNQIIAVRGLLDFDGSITADLNGTIINPVNAAPPVIVPGVSMPGTFLGSGAPALNAGQASGPLTWEPGWRLTAGWRFRDGLAVEVSWMSLVEAKYAAVATLVPPTLNPGPLLLETFLFSPVVNFPNDYAGPALKVALGNPFAAYGIWNGATVETIEFVQRFSQYDINARVPIFETDYCRCYGWVGFRHVSLWERFKWRVVAEDFTGSANQDDVALYNNIVSNQMYGPDVGWGSEVYCCKGFALSLDLKAAGMVDFVHEIASYERGDFATKAKRAKKTFEFVPELDAIASLWWYPIEGVQVKIGYNFLNFFNTISSPNPVDFNFASLNPEWKTTYRWIDGFNAGIGFIF